MTALGCPCAFRPSPSPGCAGGFARCVRRCTYFWRVPVYRRVADPTKSIVGPRARVKQRRASGTGSAACARCHAAIAAAWARSPMHRMTREANGIEVRAPFDGTRWRFKEDSVVLDRRGDDRYCHVETSRGARNDYRVTMVLGGRTREDFVGVDVATGGDELVLPVSYVFKTGALATKGTRSWCTSAPACAPGHAGKACVFCHNTVPQVDRLLGALCGPKLSPYQGEQVDRWLPMSGARQQALSKMAPSRSQWPRKPPSGHRLRVSQDPPTRSRARRLQLSGRVSTGRRSWRWRSVARRAMGDLTRAHAESRCASGAVACGALANVSTCRIRASYAAAQGGGTGRDTHGAANFAAQRRRVGEYQRRPAARGEGAGEPFALASYGLSLETLRTALGSANVNQAKGNFDGAIQAWTINDNDQLESGADYGPIMIAYRNGAPVRITDVATIIDGAEDTKKAWVIRLPPSS